MAPTKGRGHMMLQCIEDVFGTPDPAHPKASLSLPEMHATQSRKPNVIVILADDLGYADLGCQGSSDAKTPHIDSLAENGVRCTASYVTAPQCGPSRAAILTGRYQNRFGFESNEFAYKPGLPRSETLISDRMKAAGYATGYIGKWGVTSERHSYPPQRGFDESYWNQDGNLYFPDTPSKHNVRVHRGNDPVEQPAYSTDAFGREAVAFIERHKDEPFFLFVSFITPHVPMEAKPEDMARFPDADDPLRRTLLAMVACMDDNVGRILHALKKDELEKDTLIVFLSDNGGYPGNASRNDPFSGGKSQMLEGGIREPLILQWKGQLPSGVVYDRPVISLDILPTALAAAGAKVDPAWKLDGVNLLPFLSGEDVGAPHESLFWRFNFPLKSPQRHGWAVRQGDWKLVRNGLERRPPALYNLKDDPAEEHDLSVGYPGRVNSLRALWDQWNVGNQEPGTVVQ